MITFFMPLCYTNNLSINPFDLTPPPLRHGEGEKIFFKSPLHVNRRLYGEGI
jgi:hypothetical protein